MTDPTPNNPLPSPPRTIVEAQPLLDRAVQLIDNGEYEQAYDLLFTPMEQAAEPLALLDKLAQWHEHEWPAENLKLLLGETANAVPKPTQSGKVLRELGGAYVSLGQHRDDSSYYLIARDFYERALELAQHDSDDEAKASAIGGLGSACAGLWQLEPALGYTK